MNPRFFLIRTLLSFLLAALALSARAQPVPEFEAPRLVIAGPADAPVALRALRVNTQVSGRDALTEIVLTFFNPNGRTLEGELQFPLQEGQAVVGMAMDVGGRLREAVPVEKARGEAVFEDVTRARIDPALLSHTQGNNYKLRVYPIEPRSEKTVVLRYTESLATRGGLSAYRLPLAHADRLAAFSLNLQVDGTAAAPRVSVRGLDVPAFTRVGSSYRLEMAAREVALRGALDLAFVPAAGISVTTQRRDGRSFFVAQVPFTAFSAPRAIGTKLTLVWDSSASGAGRDHGREFALLDAYFARARNTEVRLLRVRDAVEAAQRFSIVGGDWRALRRALETTVYDGATDLGAWQPEPQSDEVLLFSDGLSNFGVPRPMQTRVPVYAVSAAQRADTARLRHLAEVSGGRFVDLTLQSADSARETLLNAASRIESITSNAAIGLVAASPFVADGSLTLAGELTEPAATVRVTVLHPGAKRQVVEVKVDAGRDAGTIAAQAWARLRIAELDADYALNRSEIQRLGAAFGLVTRETSLIILDRAQDYARHDITPPPELADEVAGWRAQTQRTAQASASAQLERVVKLFEAKQAWWTREFPKGPQPRQEIAAKDAAAGGSVMQGEPQRDRRSGSPLQTMPAPIAESSGHLATSLAPAPAAARMAKSTGTPADAAAPATTIRLRPVANDAPYAARLRVANDEQLYRVYLDERAGYADSTAFFLDVADVLYQRQQPMLATRVLSNLAEMDLENRQVLRILGARLMQAGRADLAVPVLRRVLVLAPDEPQSQRDLGLALAENGEPQAAVDALYEVARRQWLRFPEIELIALAELNAIVATSRTLLDTSRIDPRLLKNLPLDLRATMTWDADNTDIDLWVTDPNGERAYYGHPLSYQGGRISRDITSGYGPEEFSLRHAKPGKYTVTTQFYGHRQQIVSAAMTVQLALTTGFGTAAEQTQTVTLRLKDPKDQVLVGEFEVRPSP